MDMDTIDIYGLAYERGKSSTGERFPKRSRLIEAPHNHRYVFIILTISMLKNEVTSGNVTAAVTFVRRLTLTHYYLEQSTHAVST